MAEPQRALRPYSFFYEVSVEKTYLTKNNALITMKVVIEYGILLKLELKGFNSTLMHEVCSTEAYVDNGEEENLYTTPPHHRWPAKTIESYLESRSGRNVLEVIIAVEELRSELIPIVSSMRKYITSSQESMSQKFLDEAIELAQELSLAHRK